MSAASAVPLAAVPQPGALPAGLQQLLAPQRLPLLVGAALLVAGLVGVLLWSRTPDYRVLFSGMADRDGGAVVAALQQMNVPYKVADGAGAVLVPADKVAELRLKLAGQGLPKGGAVGFELMDNQRFGTSQFVEQVNYQRGLEGELARSIQSIGAIDSARVHLALPKPSLFVRDQKKPGASVVLTLHQGRSLDESQVSAIVHLVSSSVPELEAGGITVVDQRGNLLTSGRAALRGLDGSQLKYVEGVEQTYVRRIEAILQPLLGPGNVRAQVAADVDFSVVEHTDEKYRPNQEPGSAAVRSQQTGESAQTGGLQPGGIPGALSNQPPTTPVAPLAAASAPATMTPAAVAPGSSRRDVTINYEVDRSVRHTQQAAGATRRLSAAVVVNHQERRGANGKLERVALSAQELEQVTSLVKEAMGYSPSRGDSLSVVNSPFSAEPPPQEVQVPAWRDPQLLELARSVAPWITVAVLALILWLAVLRPWQRRQLAVVQAPVAPALTGTASPLAVPAPADESARQAGVERQRSNTEYAQLTAEKDPRLVASLVRHWMNT